MRRTLGFETVRARVFRCSSVCNRRSNGRTWFEKVFPEDKFAHWTIDRVAKRIGEKCRDRVDGARNASAYSCLVTVTGYRVGLLARFVKATARRYFSLVV